MKLLLLEDDPVSCAFLREVLEATPAVVDCAQSCAAAESLALSGTHVLWIFDANLPDGNGADLLRRLRASGLSTRAVALTAESGRDRLSELSVAGFEQVLQKPIAANVLLAAIRRLTAECKSVGTSDTGISELWDEARALAAVGGKAESALALRNMFLTELPGQVESMRSAFAAADHTTIRDQLHRLKASCGFVGASRLLLAVNRLSSEITEANFDDFNEVTRLQLHLHALTPAGF